MLIHPVWYKLFRTAATFALIALCGELAAVGQAATVDIHPGADIPSVVAANPAGTTFLIYPGTYRLTQPITPKDGDSFIGQTACAPPTTPCQAILNGSKLLTSFSQQTVSGVTYWVADGPSQPGQLLSECDHSFPMCEYPENLHIDDEPLLRASSLSSVTTSTCYYDYGAAKIYFLQDPNGHTVESSSTPVAFDEGPSNITIRGLIIEKYATPGQRTAIGGQYAGTNWIVQNNEVRLNHGEGVGVSSGGKVLNNYIHNNGELGLHVLRNTTPILVQNNQIAFNNWAGFDIHYEAGGVKGGVVTDLTAEGNYIHDNQGAGLWCDMACTGGTYVNNTVTNNAYHGIFHEISHTWTIENNVVTGNGFGTSWGEWLGGAGIEIDESDHVEVANNFVANNSREIQLGMAARPNAPWADLNNGYVHNNITVTGGTNGTTGLHTSVGDAYYTSKDNRFENDTYCMPSSSRGWFFWMNAYETTPEWQAYGQDTDGKWACPAVYLSSPTAGTTLSGNVSVAAAAADTGSITKVVFYMDGVELATTTSSPYTYSWNTTKAANGTHVIKAQAYNAADESSTYSVTVTVKNP
jgi:parallel beta-helix repeat protein